MSSSSPKGSQCFLAHLFHGAPRRTHCRCLVFNPSWNAAADPSLSMGSSSEKLSNREDSLLNFEKVALLNESIRTKFKRPNFLSPL